MSLSRTASSTVSTVRTSSWGNVARAQSTNACVLPALRPFTLTVVMLGRTATNASSEVWFMTPGATMPTVRASRVARWRAPTPGTAPVR